RAPAQVAASVERAPIHGDGIRRRGAVEAETGVVDTAAAVEGERRVATGVVDATGEPRDSRDERPLVRRVGRHAAPGRAAVVREVGARVTVTERAARRAAYRARPRARDVVIRGGDDAIRIVRID